jgi:hypothetical protein
MCIPHYTAVDILQTDMVGSLDTLQVNQQVCNLGLPIAAVVFYGVAKSGWGPTLAELAVYLYLLVLVNIS